MVVLVECLISLSSYMSLIYVNKFQLNTVSSLLFQRQLAGNQNDDFDWSALLNEDINGVAGADDEFLKPKSPVGYSDIEEEDNDIATTGKEREVKNRIRKKRVPIYVEDENNVEGRQKRAEIDMDRCKGYYSLALEILEKKDEDGDILPGLPHVGWPWSPDYGIAKYYSEDWASELYPLRISWQSFESCLGNILILAKNENDIIPVEIIDQVGDLESTFVLYKSILTSSEQLYKALYIYCCADAGIEVREVKLKNKLPWWPYTCRYYDQNDEAIIPPYEPVEVEDMGEVEEVEEEEFVEDEEGGVEQEEDDGDVSQDKEIAVEAEGGEQDEGVAAVEEEDPFISRLARVRVFKHNAFDADIHLLPGC